jgi:hypothetical protein
MNAKVNLRVFRFGNTAGHCPLSEEYLYIHDVSVVGSTFLQATGCYTDPSFSIVSDNGWGRTLDL